ncbi:MAG TPA: HAD family hydrolase [Steroidobacteraceae bacterium]|jgi:FMN phosphatase YigB (HAD superfamily)|nr:HAD family hydrolase [Steroidobacteraceae bacterium]
MSVAAGIVVLFDVDDTLLDNDAVQEDLSAHLQRTLGAANRDRYWSIFEALRDELGYADYLGALQRYRLEAADDPRVLLLASFLLDYPFASRLYPGALAALAHMQRLATTVILSDGDVVLQPRKIQRSGLWEAVQGRVLIYIHKEQMLQQVERLYPASHYVMVDDKLRILAAVKQYWGARVSSIFPRQGRYAHDAGIIAAYPAADLSIDTIGDLAGYDIGALLQS